MSAALSKAIYRRLSGLEILSGYAAAFDSSNTQYLTGGDTADLSGGDVPFTYAGWHYLSATGRGAPQGLAGKWTGSTATNEWRIYEETGRIKANFGSGAANSADLPAPGNNVTQVTAGAWFFVVLQHNPATDTISLSVNGGTPATAAWANGINDSATAFELGGVVQAALLNQAGYVDAAGIWKAALTPAQIAALYNAGAGVDYPPSSCMSGLVAWWGLEETSGAFMDQTGRNNHLARVGAVTQATGKAGPGTWAQSQLVALLGTATLPGGATKRAVWNGNRASVTAYPAITFRESGGGQDRRFLTHTGVVTEPIYDMEFWTDTRSATVLHQMADYAEQLLDLRRGVVGLPVLDSGALRDMQAMTGLQEVYDEDREAWVGLTRWRFVECRY